jgi:hypothetical protein
MTEKISPFIEKLDNNEYARILKVVKETNEESIDDGNDNKYNLAIMDRSLNKIADDISNLLVNFVNDYSLKLSEAKKYSSGDNILSNGKLYIDAFILYLKEMDHLFYMGIIFILISIIIYFFSITFL